MRRSVQLLSSYAVNNVVSMRHLKTTNLRMFKYLESNFDRLSSLLSAEGIAVLNDLKPVRDPAALQAYLQYHFGQEVDLTDLREKHRSIYRAIDQLGNARELLSGWGFTVRYRCIFTMAMLDDKLRETAAPNGTVRLDRSLSNRLSYQADKQGTTVEEYLDRLGLRLPAPPTGIDTAEIQRLKDEQQLSFRQIASKLGISKSTAEKHYKKEK